MIQKENSPIPKVQIPCLQENAGVAALQHVFDSHLLCPILHNDEDRGCDHLLFT
mgnify:CR=1 FL=1